MALKNQLLINVLEVNILNYTQNSKREYKMKYKKILCKAKNKQSRLFVTVCICV